MHSEQISRNLFLRGKTVMVKEQRALLSEESLAS